MSVIQKIYELVCQVQKTNEYNVHKLVVTRSKYAVTIFRAQAEQIIGPPLQIILSVYKNVAHLLSTFDLDACAVAFLPNKGVYCSPRALRALRYSVNVFDSDLQGNGLL